MKITFIGAGSTVFLKNVLGDCMLTPALGSFEAALYDIDAERLNDSVLLAEKLRDTLGSTVTVTAHLGTEHRREALRGADFVVNTVQIGGYEPCTVIDFEIPKRYGLRQTIGDTLGIGGIFRALRTIPFMRELAEDMAAVCPKAWLLNYTNPMAMLTGYMTRFTDIRTVGLCHSVQVCTPHLLRDLGIEAQGVHDLIAGINHMGWLLDVRDGEGRDLYPEIRRRAAEKNAAGKHHDMVRYDYIRNFGYYCTESSEHNAEYNMFYLKSAHPELVERFNIPLDEYPRRCVEQIKNWSAQRDSLLGGSAITHERSGEYASRIMEAMVTNTPYKIGGNVLNTGLITNLPDDACVEVPCLVDAGGISPTVVGKLPTVLAAMNMTNINPQLLAIEAAVTRSRDAVYHAAMLEPHTAAELTIDQIRSMCDELLEAHKNAGFECLI